MITVAMVDDKPEIIHDLRGFMDLLERDYDISGDDFADLISEWTVQPTEYPELRKIYDDIVQDNISFINDNTDGIRGDAYYAECEHRDRIVSELNDVSDALRAKSKKGNTREDIAKWIDNIAADIETLL